MKWKRARVPAEDQRTGRKRADLLATGLNDGVAVSAAGWIPPHRVLTDVVAPCRSHSHVQQVERFRDQIVELGQACNAGGQHGVFVSSRRHLNRPAGQNGNPESAPGSAQLDVRLEQAEEIATLRERRLQC